MTPLKLLFIVQRYGPEVRGGAEQAAREVAQRLAARGHHVEALTTTAKSYVDWSGDLPAGREVIEGVVVHRLPVDPLRDPEVFGRLHHRLTTATPPVAPSLEAAWIEAQGPSVPSLVPWLDEHAGRFDVVVCFTYLYATSTLGLPAAARHTATALVPCAHDEPSLALHAFDRIAHLADALIYLTPEEATLFTERFRLRTPHDVVGLGVSIDGAGTDHPSPAHQAALTDQGVGERPYLLYVGRIDPSKGTSWLVDSFVALKADDADGTADLQLVLLGDPVVATPPHPDIVVITDADDATRDAVLAGAVALVHPSPYESFGMVVTEAWAVGTPVIAFAGNDVLRGHIERSGGGVLVSNRAELAAAALLLARDRPLRDGLGRAGRAHVEESYSWPVVIERWEQALHQAARSRSTDRAQTSSAPPRPLKISGALEDDDGTKARPAHLRGATGPSAPAFSEEKTADRSEAPAGWLLQAAAAAIALITVASGVGLLAAVAGAFKPAIVLTATALLGLPAAVVAARAVPRVRSSRSAHASAIVVLAAVAVITIWNGVNHGEHLVADRDPGVYVTTARHLMDEGNVLVTGPVGPFTDATGLSPNGAGFSNIRNDGTLEPQFPHLTAVTVAFGGWINESAMFLVTPLLAGLGLILLYAWACTLVGPRWAVLAAMLTGVTMPFMVFARDVYSEPITTVLLFGGLLLLHLAQLSGRRSVWLLAGLALGATNMARVDSWLYLAPILLALVLAVQLARGDRRRPVAAGAAWCVLGLAATSTLGFWDTATLTGGYYRDSLAPRLPAMLAAAGVATVVGWFVAPLLWRVRSTTSNDPEPRPTWFLRGALATLAVGCAGFFAWGYWIRPDAGDLPPLAHEGLNTLSYLPQATTLSMRWLEWYFGPVALAAALAGLLWSVVRLGRPHRVDPAVVAGLGAVLITLLLYLWTPSITPDHPWAMRRFAAVALPGLAVGVAATAQALWAMGSARDETKRRWAKMRAGGAATVALAVATASLATTAAITWPTRTARAQIPMHERMHEICAAMGDDAAVLVPIDGILALMMSVPVGVWCDIPSAGGRPGLTAEDVARLAVDWDTEGRRLVVLSSSATPVMNTLLPTGLVDRTITLAPVYPKEIEPTLRRRPGRVVADGRLGKGPDGEVTFYIYEVDVDASRRFLQDDHTDPVAGEESEGALSPAVPASSEGPGR